MRKNRIKKHGQDDSVFITAEIGINHNGDINLAKQLIDAAIKAGCDAVKFQKRDVEKFIRRVYWILQEKVLGVPQQENKN